MLRGQAQGTIHPFIRPLSLQDGGEHTSHCPIRFRITRPTGVLLIVSGEIPVAQARDDMAGATTRVIYLAADSQVSRPSTSNIMTMRKTQPSKNSPLPTSLDLLPVGTYLLSGLPVTMMPPRLTVSGTLICL